MPTALLSVYDKAGIVEFAEGLHQLGWRIVSSGGTAKAIAATGTPVTDLADLTGVPAILDHRVVTLHPKIHGGLLADPTNEQHRAEMAEYGIDAIDLLVCNLYPFASNPSIELIDIGGPAMVRAAAKNHRFVAVVVDPSDYGVVLDELRTDGAIGASTKQRLARDAFAQIAAYDAQIATWFDDKAPAVGLPDNLHLSLRKVQPLRYGENPHQTGARYRLEGGRSWWDDAVQHGGKEMSYLNLFDTEAAWRLVQRFDEAACVIVKHANPCGVAASDDITDAYIKANAGDPVSAFGGIIVFTSTVDLETAQALSEQFVEVVVSPEFTPEALELLSQKPNLRVLQDEERRLRATRELDVRQVDGGLLVQEQDTVVAEPDELEVVTEREPSMEEWRDLSFAWRVCRHVKSNAIVLARGEATIGIGAGQMSRVDSVKIAVERPWITDREGLVLASDAFFPFADGPEAAMDGGVRAIIQPGGSVRDQEVIDAVNARGGTMVFTRRRHFRH